MENTVIRVLYSNFEEGPGFPLLNFERGSQSSTFKLQGGSRVSLLNLGGASRVPDPKAPGSGVPVPLLHYATHKKIITTEIVNLTCTNLIVTHSLKPDQLPKNNSELLSLAFWQPAIRRCFNKNKNFKDARKRIHSE